MNNDKSYDKLIFAVFTVNYHSNEWFQNIPQLWLKESSWRCNFLFNNHTYSYSKIQELLEIHYNITTHPDDT